MLCASQQGDRIGECMGTARLCHEPCRFAGPLYAIPRNDRRSALGTRSYRWHLVTHCSQNFSPGSHAERTGRGVNRASVGSAPTTKDSGIASVAFISTPREDQASFPLQVSALYF